MSIFEVKNGQLERKDVAEAAQLIAIDTDDILGGGAGEETSAQALLDGIAGELGGLDSSKQPKTLSSPISIDGSSKTTVESALSGLNDYADAQEDEISAICNVYGSKNICDVSNAVNASNIVSAVDANGIISFKDVSTVIWSSSYIGAFRVKSGVMYKLRTSDGAPIPYGRIGVSTSPTDVPAAATAPDVTYHTSGASRSSVLNVIIGECEFTANADATIYLWMCTDASTELHTAFNRGIMLMDARIKDDTYVPYVPTNRELVPWDANSVLGAKNLVTVTATTSTATNVTFTVNADKTVSISGSANTSATIKDLNSYTGAQLKAMGSRLLLSGGAALAYLAIRSSDWSKIIRSYGGDVLVNTAELVDATTYYLTIGINANDNANGVTIKPMLRLAEDTDPAYQPYAMTNQQLTDAVAYESGQGAADTSKMSTYASAKYYKIGRVCVVNILLQYISASTPASGDIVFTGLPLPADNMSGVLTARDNADPINVLITTNNSDGVIKSQNSNVTKSRQYFGSLIYITA